MSFSPAKNLNPRHPREEIVEKKLPHARLKLPQALDWIWSEGFGSEGLREGSSGGRVRELGEGVCSGEGGREI